MVAYVEVSSTPVISNNHASWKFLKQKNREDNHFLYDTKSLLVDITQVDMVQVRYGSRSAYLNC